MFEAPKEPFSLNKELLSCPRVSHVAVAAPANAALNIWHFHVRIVLLRRFSAFFCVVQKKRLVPVREPRTFRCSVLQQRGPALFSGVEDQRLQQVLSRAAERWCS